MSPLKGMSDSQARVYKALEAAGDRGITTQEFIQSFAGSRFSARILELRSKFGCQISTERLSANSSRYRLISPPVGVEGGGGVEALALSDARGPSRQAASSLSADTLFDAPSERKKKSKARKMPDWRDLPVGWNE